MRVSRLSFDDLSSLEARLLERFLSGKIDIRTYSTEWDWLVEFAGWTWSEYENEIDERWTRLCSHPQPAFLC